MRTGVVLIYPFVHEQFQKESRTSPSHGFVSVAARIKANRR